MDGSRRSCILRILWRRRRESKQERKCAASAKPQAVLGHETNTRENNCNGRRALSRKRCCRAKPLAMSAEKFLVAVAGGSGRSTLPFLADAGESKSAQFEISTQPAKHRGFHLIVLFLEGAGDIVGALALLAIVDEVILAKDGAQPAERLGVDAGPEKSEVANVAMEFALGTALGRKRLRLDHHAGHFFQALALCVPQAINIVNVNKAGKQLRKVIDQGRIAQPQSFDERVFGKPGEHSPERMICLWRPHGHDLFASRGAGRAFLGTLAPIS